MILVRYCTVCKADVPEARARKASPYCSNECRQLARKELRAYRAQLVCRFCGRTKPRKPRPHTDSTTQSLALPVAPGATPPEGTGRADGVSQ